MYFNIWEQTKLQQCGKESKFILPIVLLIVN